MSEQVWARGGGNLGLGNLGLGTGLCDEEGPLVDMMLWRITASTNRVDTLTRASSHLEYWGGEEGP